MQTKQIREDYKINRNQKIYEEYISTDTSYNKLSKKYGISPQRIQYIIADLKTKGLGETLTLDSTESDRDRFKNLAIELREQGKLLVAIKMFEEIIAWDIEHQNYRGLGNVYGEIQNAYRKLAKNTKSKKEQLKILKTIDTYIESFLELARTDKVPEGDKVIQNVHKVLNILQRVALQLDDKKELAQLLKNAEDLINSCIVGLPGSLAHKAWPLRIKSEILARQGKLEDALETLQEAEEFLSKGYFQELSWQEEHVRKTKGQIDNNQAVLKLTVWKLQIHLGYAYIYKELKKNLLAAFHANAVATYPDPEGTFKELKQQSKKLLEEI